MPWTDKQKQLAARACHQVGIDDDTRKLILRQFDNAKFDRQGRAVAEPTSTSARLNNSDFEQFMACVERASGGQQLLHFSRGYWQAQERAEGQRLIYRIQRQAEDLERFGALQPGALGGWVRRISNDRTDQVDALTTRELGNLIEAFKAFGKRHALQEA